MRHEPILLEDAISARNKTTGRLFGFGWLVILVVFGGFIAWSVLAPFEGAVAATGAVAVESEHKAIQHLEGGIVADIAVREGDAVAEGMVLIRLDTTKIQAEFDSVRSRLFDLHAREARLVAEHQDLTELSLANTAEAFMGESAFANALADQQSLLVARRQSRSTQVSILNQRIAQLQRRVDGLRSEAAAKTDQASLIQSEINDFASLVERGLAPRPRLLSLQREQVELSGAGNALQSEIEATRVQIGEARMEVINLTEGFRETTLEELGLIRTELADLSAQYIALQDRMSRLDIRAPRGGRVLGVRTHTVGGVIAPGDPVMFIVPENDRLVVKARIRPQDVDKVELGQVVDLRFSAFSAQDTPQVDGTLIGLSADAVTDQSGQNSFYEGVVSFDPVAPELSDLRIVPGMPVDAMIRTEDRSVISYLLKPITDAVAVTFRE
ncbi:MAG: HlyD family type I secretion periplasmic adaptor subunit [Pseudomonadota bacterium]